MDSALHFSLSWENLYIIVNLDVHMVLAQIMVVKIYNPLSVSRNPNRPLLLKLACSRSVLFSPTSLHPLIIFGLQESEEYWGVSPQPSGSFRPKCHRCYHACSWLLLAVGLVF